MEGENRPWGSFQVLLEEAGFKVKKITVNPGARFSLQLHHRRKEHWKIVRGEGVVTRGEETFSVDAGACVDIPKDMAHRMHNTGNGPLVFIEVQQGDYLGEDDILRLDDDYGRQCGMTNTT